MSDQVCPVNLNEMGLQAMADAVDSMAMTRTHWWRQKSGPPAPVAAAG